MFRFGIWVCVGFLVVATNAAAQVGPIPAPLPPGDPVVILTTHALDGHGAELRDANIRVVDGKITSLDAEPEGTIIDLRGYTVLPGWIDTHVHLGSHWNRSGRIATVDEPPMEASLGIARAAWDTLMGGFTTVQSIGEMSEKPLRDAIRDQGFPGPRVLTSLDWIQVSMDTPDDELRALVHDRRDKGADLIKIRASNSQRLGAKPILTESQLKVLCDETKALGLRPIVHAYRSQVAAAARAGCNQVEHATYATPEELQVAIDHGLYLGPQVGLVIQNYIANKDRYLGEGNYTEEGMKIMESDLEYDFAICRQAVETPDAKLVFSSDATAGAHGRNAEEFIGRVTYCGQSPMDALVSAAKVAAESMGMDDRIGRLAPGYEADIIALARNPLDDINAVRDVVFVMRGGVVYRWSGSSGER